LRFLFSFLFTAMHVKNLALCVWEWRRYTIQYNADRKGIYGNTMVKELTSANNDYHCAT